MPPQSPSLSRASSLYDSSPPSPRATTATATTTFTHDADCDNSPTKQPRFPLGIVLDLDGTLIAEFDSDDDWLCSRDDFVRPGAVEFLRWCKARGHSLAVWTAADASWANYVLWKLCTGLHGPDHACQGATCSRGTFDFCWSRERLCVRQRIPVSAHGQVSGCRWCESYRSSCTRCACYTANAFLCPCRSTKNLHKVWARYQNTETKDSRETSPFTRQRTILVEDTPQNCIHNYGNAVYVPRYTGSAKQEAGGVVFERLKALIVAMEQVRDVRAVPRCPHNIQGPHACREQLWWRQSPSGRPSVCHPVRSGKSSWTPSSSPSPMMDCCMESMMSGLQLGTVGK